MTPSRDHRPPLLDLEHLAVTLLHGDQSVRAVRDISLQVAAGEVVALVGESGSGKSITASAVLHLLPGGAVVTGSIRFDGQELVDAPETAIRALRGTRIGMIFQDPMTSLNPVYTIGAHLRQAIRAHGSVAADEVRRRSIELLESVQMPDPEGRLKAYPHELSGGQRQRAMIAMALVGEPSLLIADEPTTALDVTVQAGILDLLQQLVRERDMALLLITHDMGVVARMAHRVVVVRDGAVVESGVSAALFAHPSAGYTKELLAAVPRVGISSRATGTTVGRPVLEVSDLRVEYRTGPLRRVAAVEGATFSIAPHETLAVVGESGSGKSSLGKSLVGLSPVTAGRITIDGQDAHIGRRQSRNRGVAKTVAIVFQDPSSSLDPRSSIGASIVAPLVWNRVVTDRREARRAGERLLEQVRLPAAWYDRYPHQLSGGQRQRVGIARALSLRPRLLIADEPTSALDVSVQAVVLELLEELQAELGFACLFISHDLAVVDRLADRILVMREGRVVEQGPSAEVLRAPKEQYTRNLLAAVPVPDPAHYATV